MYQKHFKMHQKILKVKLNQEKKQSLFPSEIPKVAKEDVWRRKADGMREQLMETYKHIAGGKKSLISMVKMVLFGG